MTRKERLELAQYFHHAWERSAYHEQRLDPKRDSQAIDDLGHVAVTARWGFWNLMGIMPWDCSSVDLNTEHPSPKIVAALDNLGKARKS